jgi:hypothetical protein
MTLITIFTILYSQTPKCMILDLETTSNIFRIILNFRVTVYSQQLIPIMIVCQAAS